MRACKHPVATGSLKTNNLLDALINNTQYAECRTAINIRNWRVLNAPAIQAFTKTGVALTFCRLEEHQSTGCLASALQRV